VAATVARCEYINYGSVMLLRGRRTPLRVSDRETCLVTGEGTWGLASNRCNRERGGRRSKEREGARRGRERGSS
jgi:5-deoxy-D-glucuronate isomerase